MGAADLAAHGGGISLVVAWLFLGFSDLVGYGDFCLLGWV
jgi:hypothetical protein